MRQKSIIFQNGTVLNLVLLAGGSEPVKFRIYSASGQHIKRDAVAVETGGPRKPKRKVFESDTTEYKMILDYVNLKYNFVQDQREIRDNLENIVRGVKALGSV